jgi:hypothetical protein
LRYYRERRSQFRGKMPPVFESFLASPSVRRELGIATPRVADFLQRHLSITSRSWNAALGILLCDTGWNVEPVRSLPVDPFIGSISHGQRRLATAHVISAWKERAGHDVHAALVELSDADREFLGGFGPSVIVRLDATSRPGISGCEAIRIVQEMTAPLRVHSPVPERLWIAPRQRGRGADVPGVADTLRFWQAFIARHRDDDVIGGLPISQVMIRKTRLEIEALRGSAGFDRALALGQHSPAVSMKNYLRSSWVRHALNEDMRTFLNAFEAAVARDIRGVATHLGISAARLRSRISFADDSGLNNLRASESQRDTKNPISIRFVPTRAALVKLHLVEIVLGERGSELASANPDRWQQHWYPLLIRASAVVRALEKTPYAPVSIQARTEATRACA